MGRANKANFESLSPYSKDPKESEYSTLDLSLTVWQVSPSWSLIPIGDVKGRPKAKKGPNMD